MQIASVSDGALLAQRSHAAAILLNWLAENGLGLVRPDLSRLATDGLRVNGLPMVAPSVLDDVFASVTLARELRTGRIDGLGRFDEGAIEWDITKPWIDHYVQTLAQSLAPDFSARTPHRFRVIITHDVDRTTGFEPTAILNALLKSTGVRRSSCLGLSVALSSGALARNIERLLNYERAHGVGAIYFMMAGPYGWGRYATRTDIQWNVSRQIARLVQQAGMTVGLHGGFHAQEHSSYAVEKERIEQVLGTPIKTHRNHYLRFDTQKLPSQLEAAGIEYDFSVGFNSRIGFRGGHAGACRTFDLALNRPTGVISIPLLFMDTMLLGRDPAQVLPELRKALEEVRQVNGCVSLLFHPELFLMDARLFDLFESVLQLCGELGADLTGHLPSATSAGKEPTATGHAAATYNGH